MFEAAVNMQDLIEARVVEAGDDCNQYAFDRLGRGLRLAGVYHPATPAPAEQAVIPETAPAGEAELPVLVLARQAIPPGCLVHVRPLGLVRFQHPNWEDTVVVAVPGLDPGQSDLVTCDDIPDERRAALLAFARANAGATDGCVVVWENAKRARALIYERRRSARLAEAQGRKVGPASPVWKPLGYRVAGARRAAEAEPHSDAEYAYRRLPPRFQQYVESYLAPTERILFAVMRPAMRSRVSGSRLFREQLQGGILFLTDQQVALVSEVLPPDRTGINYGYLVQAGVPERASAAAVVDLAGNAGLWIAWAGRDGEQRVVWEFPAAAREDLDQAVSILQGWLPIQGDVRLRRAYGAEPEGTDWETTTIDAESRLPIAKRLTEVLDELLQPGERVLARAMLPAWTDDRKETRGLAVTSRRALLIGDPIHGRKQPIGCYLLSQVTSLEYQAYLFESWLALNLCFGGKVQRIVFKHPYMEPGVQKCVLALRQQLTIVPRA